jgi:hypothetical protein
MILSQGRFLSPIGPRTDGRNNGLCRRVGAQPWQAPDKDFAGSVSLTPWRCNPYWHIAMLACNKAKMEAVERKFDFDVSLTKQPICYIDGAAKNTMFHLASQLAKLRATAGCEVHAVEGAGHWCYKHKPAECFEIVTKFFERGDG